MVVVERHLDTAVAHGTDVVLVGSEGELVGHGHIHDDACGLAVVVVDGTGQVVEDGEVKTDAPRSGLLPRDSAQTRGALIVARIDLSVEGIGTAEVVGADGGIVVGEGVLVAELSPRGAQLQIVEPAFGRLHERLLCDTPRC